MWYNRYQKDVLRRMNVKRMKRKLLALLLVVLILLAPAALAKTLRVDAADYPVKKDGWYDSMEEVAVYLTVFEKLPENYLTKKEAQGLGWEAKKGNLWDVAYGCSIGGDRFGNYEGALPDAKGRKWTECDIDFDGEYRGAERIVFSNDGLIYYTGNHYKSFDRIEVIESDEKDSGSKKQDANSDTKNTNKKNSNKKNSGKQNTEKKNSGTKDSGKKSADRGGYAYRDQSANDDFGSLFSEEELDSIVNWLFGE